MARRSTKLLRFENTLYRYKRDDQTWTIDSVNDNNSKKQVDIFEKGTQATCKHMSQKVNPTAFRLGFTKEWHFTPFLDYKVKETKHNKFLFQLFLKDYIQSSLISLKTILNKIEFKEIDNIFYINIFYYTLEKVSKKDITILDGKKKRYLSKLGNSKHIPFFEEENNSRDKTLSLNIASYGAYLEKLIAKLYSIKAKVNFYQHKNIGDTATLTANFLALELENSNANFKKALKNTMRELKNTSGIRGIRINCSGRLGKAPMAKTEWFKYGQIPLSKMNANLDFAKSISHTKYGTIGTKVWIYYYD